MTALATIRPMNEDDLDWVIKNECELHAFPWTRGNFIDALAAGYSARVMCHGERRVAYAVMLLVLDEVHLLNISVTSAMHRHGVGSEFLGRLIAEARTLRATQFFLEVRPSNEAALALYHRHRFVPIGRRSHYYPAQGGHREDAIVMRCEL